MYNRTFAGSVCSEIGGDLPSECKCDDKPLGGVITCTESLLGDTIGVVVDMEPCAKPDAFVSLEVKESSAGIDYKDTFKAGQTEPVPIPGLSVSVPLVGDAQVQADLTISGNADAFSA